MVSGPSLEALRALSHPSSIDEQVAVLKQFKNDIVGHDQRKELLVKNGAVEPLVQIVSNGKKINGKKRRSDTNGVSLQTWTSEDEARVQATLILGCLANGGPAFIPPLLAAGTHTVLLSNLSNDAAPRLVTATLQALLNLTKSWATMQTDNDNQYPPLDLFTQASNEAFCDILRQPCTNTASAQQLRLVANVIAVAAVTEDAKASLVQSGVLDSLGALLASHAIANRHVNFRGNIPRLPAAPPARVLPSVLSAISTIISNSTYRTHCFFLSSTIRDLFLNAWPANGDQRHLLGPRNGFVSVAGEPLLPPLHIPPHGTTTYYGGSRAFPALASLSAHERRGVSGFDPLPQGGDADHANAVCSWLLVLARSMQGYDRLAALRLLALVNNGIDTCLFSTGHRTEYLQKAKERERQLALLAVPLAMKLVQSASEGARSMERLSFDQQNSARLVKEEACEVLALLIQSSKELQLAAVDAGAVKHVCPVLKKTFDNVPLAKPMWSAHKSSPSDDAALSETCKMGSRGLPPEILHAMRCRQGALEAIAALADREDLHRKAIVEAGVVGCIIDSLKPFPQDLEQKLVSNRGQVSVKDGNTVPVILAACHAAKSMSRSVSLLRTSLIDAGIAMPVFNLLNHTDIEVQLAATDVCINLLLDFSPMREPLMEAGVIKTLTEHARRSQTNLRLSSLWALKHLVLGGTKEVKLSTLDELGAGWLVGAIQGEQRDGQQVSLPSGGGVGLSTPNAAGEQVDLLNPSSMDVDEPVQDEEEGDEEEDDEDGEMMYDESSSTHYQASQLRSTLNPPPPAFNSKKYLSSVRELEQNPALQAKRDDIAIQEQALDFVRNLLNGEDCAYMFDRLIEQIGPGKIFELLTVKLQPLPASARLTGGGARQVYNPVELVLGTIHIITHIANASPKHRQLLIAQKQLLQAWLPHFTHSDRRVRVMSVWAVNSLTWIEDEGDRREARQRALELRTCGIEDKVRGLQNDHDLDVKERVRTAIRQMDALL